MTTTARLTLEEFLAMEEEKPYREFIDGEVVPKPMPGKTHMILQRLLIRLFESFFPRSRRYDFGQEWRCTFGPKGAQRSFVPDFLYLPGARTAFRETIFAPPQIAVEILSPGQSAGRLADKIMFYVANGVLLVWLIDPFERTIMVFMPGRSARTLHLDDTLDGDDVIPGFSVAVEDIFAELDDETD